MVDRLPPQDIRLRDARGSINAALRSVRRAAGLSLDVLAARMNFSKSYLSNVESGRRRVTVEIARAYDAAVGTGGLLTRLLAGEPDAPVGRATELATLHRYAGDLSEGRGGVVWVEGEAGIGKSTLLRAGLVGAGPECRTLWASAHETLARFPLRVVLDQVSDDAADPELAEISTLLGGGPGIGTGDAVVAAAERLVMLVERWCASSPVLFVLDDLQWADEMTLSVWGRLRGLAGQLPLLVVGACRPVPRRPEVLALRRAVSRPDDTVLVLAPLSDDDVTRLTGRLAGAPAGPQLRAAAEQAGGNPLYLRELVDALSREHRIDVRERCAELTAPLAERLPRSLAEAIGTRLDFLTDQTRTALRLAAVLGPEPTVEELTAVTGRPARELADILDEALAAGVLTAATDRMAFRHGLIRAALYEEIPPALRIALHRQAARALAETGTSVEAVAAHLLASGPETESWVAGWLAGGAAAALAARAPHAALELIDRVPDRAELAAHRVSVLSLLGRDDEVIAAAPAALAASTDTETVGRTAWALAYSLGRSGRHVDAHAFLGEVLRRGELNQVWRARLFACDAFQARTHEIAAHAVAEAEKSGDRFALGYALHGLSAAHLWEGNPDEAAALACIERALTVIGDRPETGDLRALLLGNRVADLSNLGRVGELPEALGQALDAAERSGAPRRLATTRSIAVGAYYDYGRWDDALAELDALADLPAASLDMALGNQGIAALIAVHRDDHASLAVHLAAEPEHTDDGPYEMAGMLRVAGALALEAQGRPAEATDALMLACLHPGSTPLDPQINHECQSAVPDVVRLALAYGRRAEAEAYTDSVTARAHAGAQNIGAVAAHCQGLLKSDPDLVADAAARYTFVLDRAHAQENLAVLLAGHGDLDGAQRAYEAATATYVSLEAAWDLRRAEGRLRPLGLGRSPHRIRRRPATGWSALTPTELKVAVLVADGLSNPHIAAELHVSRRTVETHVAHILAKLGGRSRNHIAATRPG